MTIGSFIPGKQDASYIRRVQLDTNMAYNRHIS